MVWHFLQPFVVSLGSTSFSLWLGESTLRIAGLLAFHLVGITIFLGSIVPLSLRLLGLTMRQRPVAEVARDIAPFMAGGLCLVLASGFLVFTGGAEAYFAGYWFRTKMTVLLIAIIFHFTVFRRVTRSGDGRVSPMLSRAMGVLALVLWFTVGIAGRAIGFFE